jgi:phosphoglycerate dehydrogenase-like enzyme
MRILVHLPSRVEVFAAAPRQLEWLQARLPQHDVRAARNGADLLAQLPEAQVAVVWRFEAGWYAAAPSLREVCTPAAGHELIDPDPSGRVKRSFGAFHGQIMAESLVAMISFMNRRLGAALNAQREARWRRELFDSTRRLAGQTALIVGYGAIGRHAARLLTALGMKINGLKRNTATGAEGVSRLFAASELHAAVADADHVACVLPGDTNSDRVIDAGVIARMKPSAFLYNVGRGNAIDADALRDALESERIAGAFLDVFPEEPLPPESPLWRTRNLYITPHASAIARDYLDLYFEELAARLTAESARAD